MSLSVLRQTRLARQKPGVVMVVIADLPRWFDADAGTVVIRPGDSPSAMDWRPMVGLLAAVFTVAERPDLTLSVLDALQAAGARLFGAASSLGVFPLLTDSTEEHESLLRRAWEALCRC